MAKVVYVRNGGSVLAPSKAKVVDVPGSSRMKPHITVDGAEFKHCPCCDTWRRLSKFSVSNSTWDGLQDLCVPCHADFSARQLAARRVAQSKKASVNFH
jgi:hypothetical protein